MRTISSSVLALGFIVAMAIGTSAPVIAQGVYVNGPGFGVQLGAPERSYQPEGYYQPENRRDRDGRYHNYYAGSNGEGRSFNGCPRHYTIQDGSCKPYRGY